MDYLIYFFVFLIFLILIIFGLPFKSTYYKNEIADLQKETIRENFKTSSENDVKQGASTFYDWGLRDSNDVPEECDIEPPPKSKSCSGGKCLGDKNTYVQNDYYILPEDKKQEQPTCGNCEADKCKNIDRYVLKSSVPACPDMSEYALKSMVKPCPDLKDYMLKSEIPPCPERPDLSKYVLKSQIPACPTPVICPECPVCPPAYKYIQDDPRFKNWLIRFEDEIENKINKLYIRKTDCNKKVDNSYKKGMEEGKNNAYRVIAQGAGPDVLKKCLINGGRNNENPPPSKQPNRDSTSPSSNPNRGSTGPSSNPNRGSTGPSKDQQRITDLEKKLEFEKNNRREKKLSESSKINTTSGDDEFIIGWDPTSLGFGAINYQMRKPEIK